MDVFTTMQILASGLGAERVRMNTTASNLANVNTTRTPEGGPYKRLDPVFEAARVDPNNSFGDELMEALQVVEVPEITADTSPPRQVFDPTHPDANEEGYVSMPNIELVEEMVNMITASRSYESGITALKSVIDMAKASLKLGS